MFGQAINFGSLSGVAGDFQAHFLAVAGGGGGGNAGGGAGGFRTSYGTSGGNSSAENPLELSFSTRYDITIGAGGARYAWTAAGNGSNGGNTTIAENGGSTLISCVGGGGGGGINKTPTFGNCIYSGATGSNYLSLDPNTAGYYGWYRSGSSGGSGGGNSSDYYGGSGIYAPSGTLNQGSAGGKSGQTKRGAAGGGGGAGAIGGEGLGQYLTLQTGGNGGNGLQSNITGTNTYYAGGGGGGGNAFFNYTDDQYINGTGGLGGGGSCRAPLGWDYTGSEETPTDNQRCANGLVNLSSYNATSNTGGGGAGRGGNGGSGIVIIRIPTANLGSSVGASTSLSGDDTILVFNSSGYFITA